MLLTFLDNRFSYVRLIIGLWVQPVADAGMKAGDTIHLPPMQEASSCWHTDTARHTRLFIRRVKYLPCKARKVASSFSNILKFFALIHGYLMLWESGANAIHVRRVVVVVDVAVVVDIPEVRGVANIR